MSDSPAKKLDFTASNKENLYANDTVAIPVVGIPDLDDLDIPAEVKVPEGLKEEEQDEPLLQENAQRFVLFPIKYHEVSTRSSRVGTR